MYHTAKLDKTLEAVSCVFRDREAPSRLICNKDTLHNFLCYWMIQGIKQDLNLNRQKGFYLISSNSTGLKVGTRRQVDSLFWQKQKPTKLVSL